MSAVLRSHIAWGVAMPFYLWLGDRRGVERMDIWAPPTRVRRYIWQLALRVLAG